MTSDLRRTLRPKGLREASRFALETEAREPQADWVPLSQAPYFCTADGCMTSAKNWNDSVYAELQRFACRVHRMRLYPELVGLSPPEWSLKGSKTRMEVWIRAMGITTLISPGSIHVHPGEYFEFDHHWLISGSSNLILQDPQWDEISPDERIAALWHQQLLSALLYSWRSGFAQAVRSGTAHIMARKNSVLSPLERVTWDQWQFFRLDQRSQTPREPFWSRPILSTATGPAGERLYAIYIAPGLERKEGLTAEQKCRQWLLGLMRDYPDRSPKPLGLLAGEAISLFPALSKRGFQRCYFDAREETGNGNWSRPGAPSKSRQESPQKK
jgi:hypothetical protein